MRMSKKHKPELIVSKDKNRYVLNHPYLLGEYVYATDGKKMIKIKINLDEGDKDGVIPLLALSLSRQVKKDYLNIKLNENVLVESDTGKISFERDAQGEFPICENVIPKEDVKWRIALNAKLLKQLSDAMGSEGVILEIIAEDKAMIVKPLTKDENVVGILMPMRLATT